ncbi:beta-lactamase family protein [Nocardia terpenica]|uniref:serine hydrolase domain-containing protein n=1 Tax=Nocardia terpenica TaxID=455432 RepID=UPI001895875E|nr:serine hydrolase domain-containing protein [Nocardia terpenica]MBF6059178.1 beta-lactamase family protein [Nocardia terpenica]MBF6103283.1 beta-lactamase family protein [Nocardia terpenica]MBF6110528.1 beta-lactamase family protein [Nocardia terpenica]MBF6116659.1 beta-lactamase family protein [Nocardia terpenica]
MRPSPFPIAVAVLILTGCATSTTPSAPATTVSGPDARAGAVRADLDGLVHAGAVGALATLTEGDRTITLAAGSASIAAGAPMPTDPPQHVRIGSVTKTFTAAVVLQLVAEGKVSLDTPIDAYLPGLLSGQGVDGTLITVRELLQHRSGLPELTEDPEIDEYQAARTGRIFTPAEEIAIALRRPAQFPPGTRTKYTNTNFIVAGMLIERVTGDWYGNEVQRRILTPLGLTGTYLPPAGEVDLRDPHPVGYATIDDKQTDTTRVEPSIPWSAGAMVSTGADLDRFFVALLNGKVVAGEQLRQMLTGAPLDEMLGLNYGLGLMSAPLACGAQYAGHTGGITGFSTISGATREGRAVTIAMTGEVGMPDMKALLEHALCP